MEPSSEDTRSVGHSPVHRMLGLELLERSATHAEARLEVREEFLQEEGVVQGGILAALADATAVYLLMPTLTREQSMTSIEFKLNFLRPARMGAGALLARCDLVQRGRRIALARTLIDQAGHTVASGLFTYLFSEKR